MQEDLWGLLKLPKKAAHSLLPTTPLWEHSCLLAITLDEPAGVTSGKC